MAITKVDRFFGLTESSIKEDTFVSIELKNKTSKDEALKKVMCKLVELKKGLHLSFTFRYPTRDETKNYKPKEGLNILRDLLQTAFYQSDLITKDQTVYYNRKGKESIKITESNSRPVPSRSHDKIKNTYVNPTAQFLKELGITSSSGNLIGVKQSKWKQINKFVEIIDKLVDDLGANSSFKAIDMGSGKAYLTFALYNHL